MSFNDYMTSCNDNNITHIIITMCNNYGYGIYAYMTNEIAAYGKLKEITRNGGKGKVYQYNKNDTVNNNSYFNYAMRHFFS